MLSNWDGLSAFGNRFFVSGTPIFVLGLAVFFDGLERAWNERGALIASAAATTVLILWNLGFIFQWGTHMIPARGPISLRMPRTTNSRWFPRSQLDGKNYLRNARSLMHQIEPEDVRQLKTQGERVPSDSEMAAPNSRPCELPCCSLLRRTAGGRFPLASFGRAAS